MLRILVATAAGLMLSGAAVAQDAYDWTGFYAGVLGGISSGTTVDSANPSATEQKITGASYGAAIGADVQMGGLVIGVAADAQLAKIGASWDGDSIYDPYYTTDTITSVSTLKARFGYATDRFLPYLTGGLAYATMDHALGCDPAHAPGGTLGCHVPFEDHGKAGSFGYVVGAGLEAAITDSVTLKGEYLYHSFGSNKVTLEDPNYMSLSNRDFRTSFGTIALGVNLRF